MKIDAFFACSKLLWPKWKKKLYSMYRYLDKIVLVAKQIEI